MSKVCYICNKIGVSGHNVSHSKQRTKRIFGANLIATKVMVGGNRRSVLVCTRCLKTMTKSATPRRVHRRTKRKTA